MDSHTQAFISKFRTLENLLKRNTGGVYNLSFKEALRRIPGQVTSYLSLRLISVSDNGSVIAYTPKDFKHHQEK